MGERSQLATLEIARTKSKRSSPPLTKERPEIAAGATLNAEALHALRSMFLLLDEWDRALQHDSSDSSQDCAIAVDLKSPCVRR